MPQPNPFVPLESVLPAENESTTQKSVPRDKLEVVL